MASCSASTSSTKCWWSARRRTNIRLLADGDVRQGVHLFPMPEQDVEQKADVRHPARDDGVDPSQPLQRRLSLPTLQFLGDDLGMIKCGHDVAVAGQMRA